jgi:hypothetical protein
MNHHISSLTCVSEIIPANGYLFRILLNEHLQQPIALQVNQWLSHSHLSHLGWGSFYAFLSDGVNIVEAHYNSDDGQE